MTRPKCYVWSDLGLSHGTKDSLTSLPIDEWAGWQGQRSEVVTGWVGGDMKVKHLHLPPTLALLWPPCVSLGR